MIYPMAFLKGIGNKSIIGDCLKSIAFCHFEHIHFVQCKLREKSQLADN